jgi:hypothetical protein
LLPFAVISATDVTLVIIILVAVVIFAIVVPLVTIAIAICMPLLLLPLSSLPLPLQLPYWFLCTLMLLPSLFAVTPIGAIFFAAPVVTHLTAIVIIKGHQRLKHPH